MRSVVITGVSTGIGYASAKKLIANGFRVFGSVRSPNDAQRLGKELGTNFVALIFDVTDEEAIKKAAEYVREQLQGKTLAGLVNNAGIVVPGAMMDVPVEGFRQQLEVNVLGQISVTQNFVPLLGADKSLKGEPGKIINIGSRAGKLISPFLGAYTMSKHCLEAFNDTLRLELMLYGIDVILIGPGAINTPIWEKSLARVDEEKLKKSDYYAPIQQFKDYIFKVAVKGAYPVEKIASLVLHILNNPHPKPRYAPISSKFTTWILPHILPKRMVDRAMAKFLGLSRKV